jgi:hypothetical protein
MLGLGPIAFAAPWLLAGLAALPAIYWLLRVTPPLPRRLPFPAVRLLRDLAAREETPHHTPWWLLVFRLALAALVVLALAQPVLNPNAALPGNGPVIAAVDNGWAAARDWPDRRRALDQLIDQAGREGRRVVLLPTAPMPGGEPPGPSEALTAAEAREAAEALQPVPWPVDRAAALEALDLPAIDGARHVVWLSDGLAGPDSDAFAARLQRLGSLEVVAPEAQATPLVLQPPEAAGADLAATVLAAAPAEPRSVLVRASGPNGRLLGDRAGEIAPGQTGTSVRLDLPPPLRNQVARLEAVGEGTAASVALLDERWQRRVVGLVGEEARSAAQPLLAPGHYLARALEPYGEVRRGGIADLTGADVTALLLPDRGAPTPEEAAALESWMAGGGVLIRFAGPLLAANPDPLVPVPLRRGDRTLGGALSWTDPMPLAPFPPESPLAGLDIPEEVRIDRQVLAEPALDLAERTWARLADGTPLVTAAPREEGWLVLVHTAAEPGWSNLPLSGLFPDMLRRLAALGTGRAAATAGPVLEPLQTLDARGRLGQPPPTALPLSGNLAEATVSPDHPPGFYGAGEARFALNLGSRLEAPAALTDLPSGVVRAGYGARGEVLLMPWLMAAALALAMLDLALALALRGLTPRPRRVRAAPAALAGAALVGAALAAGLAAPQPARAQADDVRAAELANRTYLAFVETGDPAVDEVSRSGLERLSAVLRRRTAAEPAGAVAVDPAYDELAFFPLIYWPITAAQEGLSGATVERLNGYLRNGGMILFDTRDRGESAFGAGAGTRRLRTMLTGLDVPPLQPVPPEHVLTRAFYLLQDFPGRYAGGEVWVERGDAHVNDGVSSIIIGGHDWAGAWAADDGGQPLYPAVPGGERQRELAFRFGVNLVMYALTGNYKADQVHVPTILERLGQ